ncbi:HAD-IA family hydrolase [Roseococcus sp. SYP-B2431]|uniref:HAD-IA family hydrolase n=1 Tax=Roseococcus sp. SYP-B2431 TaxID=2496640 RepID=UPI001F10EA3E|nr:HAD-IA family hydrolase [Roseococcus sp. SYP-B2431]
MLDFDGTLADSAPWFAGELNRVARRFGFREVGDEEMERMRRMNTAAILRFLRVPSWKLPFIARHMRRRVAEEAASIPLFPGTRALLERLSRRAPLAIASSNSEANIRRILGRSAAQIRHYDCGASLFGKAKKFRRLIHRAEADPRAVLCIGDELRDIEAAQMAGSRSVAVTWGYAAAEVWVGGRPDLVVDKMDALPALLEAYLP